MRSYAIIAACLVIGVQVTSGVGNMLSIANEAECKEASGTCIHRDSCPLERNVFQEGCGETLYGCCITKTIICASKDGSFISESECDAKTGYKGTGMHLGNDTCCAPQVSGGGSGGGGDGGQGEGRGNGTGQVKGQGPSDGEGQGHGSENGSGSGSGSGQEQDQKKGQGNGKGQGSEGTEEQSQGKANAAGLARLSYFMPVVFAVVCSYHAVV